MISRHSFFFICIYFFMSWCPEFALLPLYLLNFLRFFDDIFVHSFLWSVAYSYFWGHRDFTPLQHSVQLSGIARRCSHSFSFVVSQAACLHFGTDTWRRTKHVCIFFLVFFSAFIYQFLVVILLCGGRSTDRYIICIVSLDGDVALYVCVCVWTGSLFFSVFVLVICFPVVIILDVKSL